MATKPGPESYRPVLWGPAISSATTDYNEVPVEHPVATHWVAHYQNIVRKARIFPRTPVDLQLPTDVGKKEKVEEVRGGQNTGGQGEKLGKGGHDRGCGGWKREWTQW